MDAFESWSLGDIVTIPPRGPLTVRAKYQRPDSPTSGFLVLGECEAVVLREGDSVWVHLPVGDFPESVKFGRSIAEGACSFWAPHLPAQTQALGQMVWRMVRPRSSVTPALIVWRGPARTVFMPIHTVDRSRISALRMPVNDAARSGIVRRFSAEVLPVGSPAAAPAPARPLTSLPR